MIPLPISRYDIVQAFFPEGTTGRAFVFAHLENNHTGSIYVDNLEAPKTLIAALTCEFNYIAGDTGNEEINRGIRKLITRELADGDGYALVFPTTSAWQHALKSLFHDAPEVHHPTRVEYLFNRERFNTLQGDGRARVPQGYEIRPYDRALVENTELPDFWGGIDTFLERGIGYAVVGNGEVVSRCHAVMIGDGEAEISIETAKPHRRQGLASLATCAFIEHCLACDLMPAWSCWSEKTPSRRLAESLGFVYHTETSALVIKVA
jgi:RimJ/RimL family protein N-acetyltransferase